MLSSLLWAVIGAVISLAVTAGAYRARIRWERHRRVRAARSAGLSRQHYDSAVTIGSRATRVHLVEGSGDFEFRPELVRIRWSPTPVARPPQVETLRSKVLEEMGAPDPGASGATVQSAWQGGSLVAMTRYSSSRSGLDEDPALTLHCCPVDYATFSATVTQIDRRFELDDGAGVRNTTLRAEFLDGREEESVERPLPFLANGVGVVLVVFTDDDKVILTRRRANALARPGELDVSVVEGLHATFDRAGADGISPYNAAARGCREELGLEVDAGDVTLLGFGVDLTYYQWNFFGVVDARQHSGELLANAALHAKDRFEGRLQAAPADAGILFARVKEEGMWDTGLVALYLGLCHRHWINTARAAARRVFT